MLCAGHDNKNKLSVDYNDTEAIIKIDNHYSGDHRTTCNNKVSSDIEGVYWIANFP